MHDAASAILNSSGPTVRGRSATALTPAILTVDTREQQAYDFSGCTSKHVAFDIQLGTLETAGYAATLHEDDGKVATAIIERKSMSDLFGTLTVGRSRFVRELERMREYAFAAIVIEGDFADIIDGPMRPESRVRPASIIGSLVAFCVRYNVPFLPAGNRRHAERLTFRLLERFVRDRADVAKVETARTHLGADQGL